MDGEIMEEWIKKKNGGKNKEEIKEKVIGKEREWGLREAQWMGK